MGDAIHRSVLLRACGLEESAEGEALDLAGQLLESITEACAFLDRDFRYRYVDPRAGALLGREPGALVGKHIWTELPEHAGQGIQEAYERAAREQVSIEIEEYLPRTQRWYVHRLHPSKHGLAIVFQDVTLRRAREEEEQRVQAAVERERLARAAAERIAHLGFWRWDIRADRVEWSDELFRIYGLDEREFGASFEAYLARVHPHDREKVKARIAEALAGLSAMTFEERIVRPSGEVRHLRSWGSVTRDASGAAVEMFGTCLDLTQLIRTTEALRHSEEWLELALDAASLGLWDHRLDSGELTWSEGVERVFGMAPGTFRGTYAAYLETVHPGDRPRVEAAIREAIESGLDHALEHRVVWPDGTVRWVASRGRVIRDEQGRGVRMAGSVLDVTEQRRADEERRKFGLLVENATDFIALASTDGRILFVNEAGRRMVGIDSAAEASTKRVGDLLTPEGLRQSLEVELPAVLKHGRWEGDTQLVHLKTGKRIDVLTASFVVHDPAGGAPLCLATVRHDVTERRALETQLRQSQKLEAIGRLAAGVAHDFNNLLMIIFGMTGLALRDRTLGAETRALVGEIEVAGERAAMLTRQLLAVSRQDADQPTVLDLNDVVRETDRMLRRLLPPDIEMALSLAPRPLAVHADRGHLEQVILNLVVNSRDAMPAGGRLTLATRDEGERVALSVADTGVGMSREVRARAFEPFFTTKEVGRGTGLGLSTVRGIVAQAGGEIGVVSEPGAGATFTVHLPHRLEPIAGRPQPRRAGGAARARETILLVDDEASVRSTIKRILALEGYRVLDTAGPDSALRLVQSHGSVVDLLVTNMGMPGMSGRELARQVRARTPALKVLFISALTEDAPGTAPTADLILQKPFTADALTATVRELLDAGEAPRQERE